MKRAAAVCAAAAILGAGFLWMCVVRVPAGSIAVLSGGGILGAGWHLTAPGAEVERIPAGPRRYAGAARLATPEGAAVELLFGVTLDLGAAQPEALQKLAGSASQGEGVSGIVAAALGAVLRQQPQAAASLPDLQAVEQQIAPLGAVKGSLTLAPPMPPPAAATEARPDPLRGIYAGPRARVLLMGLDGADWDLIEPMIQAGDLPHLAALRSRGAWGTLRSMQPMLSPLLWTTVATGRRPEEHGILDFLMVDPATGREAPISRAYRKVKALWNIASDEGITSLTVGWWATWPAERVSGAMVTERTAYSLFHLPLGERRIGATWPPGLMDRVEPLIVGDDAIEYDDLRSVADVPEAAFEQARRDLSAPQALANPLSHLIRIVASTRTYAAIAASLLERMHPDLSLIYFEGVDQVNHRFAQFLPPAMSMTRGTPAALAAAYKDAVPGFYRMQDRILGDLIKASGPGCIVLVISDHGFANGAERPVDSPPDIEGRPGLWHTMDGVLIAAGPGVRAGRLAQTAQLLDVAPTVLAMLGLPAGKDMPGHVMADLLEDPRVPASLPVIASYETIGMPLQGLDEATASPADAAMMENLKALGYIQSGSGSPQGGSGTPTWHINAGHLRLQHGELDRAQQEFEEARRLAPRFDQPLLGLAQVAVMRNKPAEAIPFLEQALRTSSDPRPSLYTRAAQVYLRAGKGAAGITFMESLQAVGRRDAFRLAAIGIMKDAGGDHDGALAAYKASLAQDAGVERALQGAYLLLRQRGDLEDLARLLTPSLSAESPLVAARAANWLALTREAQGRKPEAIQILDGVLARQPGDVMTLTNLGSMLLNTDRAAEGLALLDRAYQAQPHSVEVITNLIVGNGRAGKLADARHYFDAAEQIGIAAREPRILNAMAYACSLSGERTAAKGYLSRSLALDPRQPAARQLLADLDRSAARP